jgi:hypothetical protein
MDLSTMTAEILRKIPQAMIPNAADGNLIRRYQKFFRQHENAVVKGFYDVAFNDAMGWIYAGKRKTQTALKASNNITQGHVYTLLKSLHVRKLPASRKDPANQRILRVVSAGEKIRILALASRGEHLWMQISRP